MKFSEANSCVRMESVPPESRFDVIMDMGAIVFIPTVSSQPETCHLHPTQKCAVLFTLVQQAKTICDSESLDREIEHVKKTFRQSGNSADDIQTEVTFTAREAGLGGCCILCARHLI
jgi:hypothetical protein